MYNRILKRPMFNMGGRTYQAQGTGITSGLDTPKRGLVDGPGGYAGEKTLEEIAIEREQIMKVPEGQNFRDIVASFGVYANPYNDQGEAQTSGQLGYKQATEITALRKEKADQQKLAKLSNLESEELALSEKAKADASYKQSIDATRVAGMLDQETRLLVEAAKGENLEYKQKLKGLEAEYTANLAAANVKDYSAEYENLKKNNPDIIQTLEEYRTEQIALVTSRYKDSKNAIIVGGGTIRQRAEKIAQAIMANPTLQLSAQEALQMALYLIIGVDQAAAGLASGGRVGYQMGTSMEGVQPMETSVNVEETVSVPGETVTEDMSLTETNENSTSINIPYEEFRAQMPAEVEDNIVQLIYYNQDAFADFAQITSQDQVYAFNNKYGVSLVLPFDTETT